MIKIVVVYWDDAQAYRGPTDYDDVTEGALKVISAGILISEDETAVRFCQDSWPRRTARQIQVIPRQYITAMQIIEAE